MPEGILDLAKAPHLGRFFAWGVQPLTLLGSLALALSWLVANHYPPWTSFHNEAAAFAALCLFLLARLLDPAPVRTGALMVLFVPLGILIAVQWVVGLIHYSGDALVSGLFVLGTALSFWMGENSRPIHQRDPLTWLAALLVTAAAADVLVGVLQWHHLEGAWGIFAADRGPSMRVFSNLAQPNHLATLCLMATVLALWLRAGGKLRQWQFIALVAWLSMGLTLTESRAGLVGAAAIGVVLLWGRRHIPGARSFVFSWGGGLLLAHLLLPLANQALLLEPSRQGAIAQDASRSTMWRQALAAIGDAPLAGYGWRQTMPALKQAALKVPGTLATDYAHNVLLDVVLWVGVPLGVLLIGIVALWLLRAWRRIGSTRELVIFAAVMPVLVHSQFEFPFAYAYFLFPTAWLLGGLSSSQAALSRGMIAGGAQKVRRALAVALVAGYVTICSAIALEYLQAEEDYRVMRFELRKVGRVPQGYEAPDLVLLTQLREMLQMGRVQPQPDMSPETLLRLRDASAYNGWATLDLTYAAALGMNGRPKEAAQQLLLLRSVYGEQSASQAYDMFRAFATTHPELKDVRVP